MDVDHNGRRRESAVIRQELTRRMMLDAFAVALALTGSA